MLDKSLLDESLKLSHWELTKLVSEIETSLEISNLSCDNAYTLSSKFESSLIETLSESAALTAPITRKKINAIDINNVLFFIEIFPPLGSHYENFYINMIIL